MAENGSQSPMPSSRVSQAGARSSSRLPHQRRFDESWVEVASQPSSSSLSSIGDEIVTTGLRVGNSQHRRRRLPPAARSLSHQQTAFRATSTSSQDEYEESESEDDRLLTSSTENASHASEEAIVDGSDSDDGDNATALGMANNRSGSSFRPQPNAFSHPPSNLSQRSHSTNSAMPPPHPHSSFTRPSFSQRAQTSRARTGPSFMSPSVREDNDAALRASLTTLLSCAAAARGLPKSKEEAEARALNAGVGPSNQLMELRLLPESELMDKEQDPPQAEPARTRRRDSSARSPSRIDTPSAKAKRASSAGRAQPRAAKKKKTSAATQEETYISPSLMTWAVSAGVVVLVSVVGFGAGYIIGREVGRSEALSASVGGMNDTSSCSRDVMRSSSGTLRRFKWGAVGRTITASG